MFFNTNRFTAFFFSVSLYRIKTIFYSISVGLSFYPRYKTDSGNNKNINHTKAPSSWGISFLERLCWCYVILCVSLKFCEHQVWIQIAVRMPRISPVATQSITKNALVQTLICFSAISWKSVDFPSNFYAMHAFVFNFYVYKIKKITTASFSWNSFMLQIHKAMYHHKKEKN